MEIYIVVLLILFVFSILNIYIRRKISDVRRIYIFEFIVLSLLAGLRKDVGMDYQAYKELFGMSSNLYDMHEGGFIWLIEAFNYIGLPFEVFSFVIAFSTVLLAFRFIVKRSPYILFSILLYFALGNYYFATFNLVRQTLATVIFLNLLELVEKRRFWKYTFILLLTAYFIHATAVILIPLYFILRRDWKVRTQVAVLALTVAFCSMIVVLIEHSSYAIYLKMEFSAAVPPTYYLMSIISLVTWLYASRHLTFRGGGI